MNNKYIYVIILLVVLALFLAFNSSTIEVNFLIFQVYTSTAIVIILSAVIGFIIGAVLTYSQKKNKHSRNEKV